MSGRERNPYFDILKGIGIIAVVGGHCISHTDFMSVWRMPLFFLVSGYFFRPKPFKDYLRSNARGLLVPYLLTTFVMFLLSACLYVQGVDVHPGDSFIAIFIGAGHPSLPVFGQFFIGPIWFLPAIFWCREIYNYVYHKISKRILMGGGNSCSLYPYC